MSIDLGQRYGQGGDLGGPRPRAHRRPWAVAAVALALGVLAAAAPGVRAATLADDGGLPAPTTLDTTPTPGQIACVQPYVVGYGETIGALSVPPGAYRVSLLPGTSAISCASAAKLLTGFLQDFDGILPAPWTVNAPTGTFSGGRAGGFRLAPLAGPAPAPSGTPTGLPGAACPGTFRVMHADHVGALKLAAGPYRLTRLGAGTPTCATIARTLARFLQRPDGLLPAPWHLSATAGTFTTTNGRGFRIKPAA